MAQGKSGSEDGVALRVDRRTVIIAGGSVAVAALVGARGAAAATSSAQIDEQPADLLIARVATHQSQGAVGVVGVVAGNDAMLQAASPADVLGGDGRPRPLDAIPVGDAVAILGPNVGTASVGETVVAQRVVPCVIGVRSDVRR